MCSVWGNISECTGGISVKLATLIRHVRRALRKRISGSVLKVNDVTRPVILHWPRRTGRWCGIEAGVVAVMSVSCGTTYLSESLSGHRLSYWPLLLWGSPPIVQRRVHLQAYCIKIRIRSSPNARVKCWYLYL